MEDLHSNLLDDFTKLFTDMIRLIHRRIMILCLLVLLVGGISLIYRQAAAHPGQPLSPAAPLAAGVANETCLACHAQPDQRMTLPSGETLYLTIDPAEYDASVHGQKGYACVQCHTGFTGYPHPPLTAQTRREVTLSLYQTCERCHQGEFAATRDSVHSKALAAGNLEAAVCTDCHGAHNVVPPDQPRSRIPQTCERCHSEIYNLYKESIHGSALIGEGNPDVPSCVDCHGVHDIQGPLNSSFRLFSPQICARCHANKTLLDKYGINTDVFNTYVSDFHGETVVLFEALAPGQQTNKPVCIDCHGVHDMRKVDDPESTVIKQNLLKTCKKCHPDATTNFPDAWLSHYEPSPQHSPVVYYVDQFYKYFIPTILGGMAFFVVTDGSRRLFDRFKDRHHE
jgi:predicted CXXCH cytochrome family protein